MKFNNILHAIESNSTIVMGELLLESSNTDYSPIKLPYEFDSLEPHIDTPMEVQRIAGMIAPRRLPQDAMPR